MTDRDGVLEALDGNSSLLFFIAAGLMVVVAGLFAAETILDREMELLLGMFAPAGFGVAFLGLLGLYSTLADRTRRLARAGAFFLTLGVVGAIVLIVSHLSQLAGIVADQPAWTTAANLPLLLGVVLGFGAFAVGGLRTDAYSRIVGLFMLWPAVVFGGLILGSVSGITYPHWVHIGHSASEAIVYLGIAYFVRTSGRPTGHTTHDVSEASAHE